MVSPAQARARDKWDAEHRDVKRKSAAKSQTKRFILKLADEDDLREVQRWLAKRKETDGGKCRRTCSLCRRVVS